jgi:hypothetical protein
VAAPNNKVWRGILDVAGSQVLHVSSAVKHVDSFDSTRDLKHKSVMPTDKVTKKHESH